MDENIRFYKGKHKVKVLSQSKGNWLVETLEPFEDVVYGKSVSVKAGERRIVAPNLLFKRKGLSPPIKEHTYELKMEKKLKRFIKDKEETRWNAYSVWDLKLLRRLLSFCESYQRLQLQESTVCRSLLLASLWRQDSPW